MEAKIRRQKLMQSTRQSVVQSAARVAMERSGVQKLSMRGVALEAGYTPGALYAFFASKQALLMALLEESLARLSESVAQVRANRQSGDGGLVQRGQAWLDHFVRNPRDWELLVYFLNAPAQRSLPVEAANRVHALLRGSLEPLARSLGDLGLQGPELDRELEAILALGVGLLLAQDGARLQPPEHSPQALFSDYLQKLADARLGGSIADAARPVDAKSSSQAALFG